MSALILLPILPFAAFDRLWGSDVKIYGHSGHSLGTVGALITAVGAYFIGGPYAAAACAVWPLYRSVPFFDGSMAPTDTYEIAAAFMRHAIATALLCLVLAVEHQGFTALMLIPLAYALLATSLAAFNGATKGTLNWIVETLRGALYGAAVGYVFLG